MFRLLSLLCFLFLSVDAVPTPSVPSVVAPEKNVLRRQFAAATRLDDLSARADTISLSNKASLVYAEGSSFGRPTTLTSEVDLKSDKPILVLEEYEHLFTNIECKDNTIILSQTAFRSPTSKALGTLEDGYIITSHHGCNNAGGRKVYHILSVDDDSRRITYRVEPISWRAAFGKFDVRMRRYPHGRYRMRPHEKLPPYPYNPFHHGSPWGTPSNSSAGPTATAAAPRTTETGSYHSLNLEHSLINASLGTFGIPLPGGIETTIPVELGCADCSTYGSLDLDFGDFSLDDMDFSGTANISAYGVGAHIELFTKLPQSWEFDVPIPTLGYHYVYDVMDIFNITLDAGFHVVGGYEMEGQVEMTYGFEMTVPDGSNIVIDIMDPEDSSTKGFGNISTTLLPFQSNVQLQSLDVWIAYRSVLSLGIGLHDTNFMEDMLDLSASASIHLDLPSLHANITPVTNVDANCDPLPASKTAYQVIEESVLDSAIRIETTVGVELGGEVSFMDDDPVDLPVPALTLPLGTMCLNHDSSTQSYVTAQKVVDVAELEAKEKAAEEAAKEAKAAAKNVGKEIDKIFSNSVVDGRASFGCQKMMVALSLVFALFCTM